MSTDTWICSATQYGKNAQLKLNQPRTVEEYVSSNTLVVAPTGVGKTLVAGDIILRVGIPAVFLVPNVALMSLKRKMLLEWTYMNVQLHNSEMPLPESFDILVSTPAAFMTAQANNLLLHWRKLRCIVFDEAELILIHRPYRKLARRLKKSGFTPLIVGLIGSDTFPAREEGPTNSLQTLSHYLQIKSLHTASDAQLYDYFCAAFETISVRLPESEMPPGVFPRYERQPCLMLATFWDRIRSGTATALCKALAGTVLQMEDEVMKKDKLFQGLLKRRNKKIWAWGGDARNRATFRKNNGTLEKYYSQLGHWYEALRLLIVSWEESEFAPVILLRIFHYDKTNTISVWPKEVQNSIATFWSTAPTVFPQLEALRHILRSKLNGEGQFHGLLFVRHHVTSHILQHFVSNDSELSKQFSAQCAYANSTPGTPTLTVSKKQSRKSLKAFSEGKINLLIATETTEGRKIEFHNYSADLQQFPLTLCLFFTFETTYFPSSGMDFPKVTCIIRFDRDRPASVRKDLELRQRQQQKQISENFELLLLADTDKKEMARLKKKEQRTKRFILENVNESTALAKLNLFCAITGIQMEVRQNAKEENFETVIIYKSILREVAGCGQGRDKKEAKRNAALATVKLLQDGFKELKKRNAS